MIGRGIFPDLICQLINNYLSYWEHREKYSLVIKEYHHRYFLTKYNQGDDYLIMRRNKKNKITRRHFNHRDLYGYDISNIWGVESLKYIKTMDGQKIDLPRRYFISSGLTSVEGYLMSRLPELEAECMRQIQ